MTRLHRSKAKQPFQMAVAVVALLLVGCGKPKLDELRVRADSPQVLTEFRTELNVRYSAAELQTFDAALQELRLDAMNREVSPAEARERDMCAAANGKTFRQVEILGWQARHARLQRERAMMAGLLEADLKRQAATPGNATVATHIQNEREILARLETQLAECERQLAAWGASPSTDSTAPAKS